MATASVMTLPPVDDPQFNPPEPTAPEPAAQTVEPISQTRMGKFRSTLGRMAKAGMGAGISPTAPVPLSSSQMTPDIGTPGPTPVDYGKLL